MIVFPEIKGCSFWLAGGTVRDYAMGIHGKDRDFVVITDYSFEELVNVLEDEGFTIFQAKKEFLTIRCRKGSEAIDITYPRIEAGYEDNRHPDRVNAASTLSEDSKRRDFTINAMYLHETGDIVDFHGGQTDIKNKLIKCVGNPRERFKEDYLRILRAIRFAATLGFNIERKTHNAMVLCADSLTNAEPNRIREELNKALLTNPEYTHSELAALKLYPTLKKLGLHFELSAKERHNNKAIKE